MWYIAAAIGGVIVLAIAIVVIRNTIINNKIKNEGIEVDALVTSIKVNESVDSDGCVNYSKYFYVTYQNEQGEYMDAMLGSGKSIDNRIKKAWDEDLYQGSKVRVKYLPEKPNYAILIEIIGK